MSKSMIVVGAVFFILAAFHIQDDLAGAEHPFIVHIVPFLVLSYAVYQYRKLLRQASTLSPN